MIKIEGKLDTKVKERSKQDKVFLDGANATVKYRSSIELSGDSIFIDGKRRKNEIKKTLICC